MKKPKTYKSATMYGGQKIDSSEFLRNKARIFRG